MEWSFKIVSAILIYAVLWFEIRIFILGRQNRLVIRLFNGNIFHKIFVKKLHKVRKFPSKIYVFLSNVPVSATRCPFNPDDQAR